MEFWPAILSQKRSTGLWGRSSTRLQPIALLLWRRSNAPAHNKWEQITKFSESITQPALSPDGRMIAFIRGPETFVTPGQIYLKILPDG